MSLEQRFAESAARREAEDKVEYGQLKKRLVQLQIEQFEHGQHYQARMNAQANCVGTFVGWLAILCVLGMVVFELYVQKLDKGQYRWK